MSEWYCYTLRTVNCENPKNQCAHKNDVATVALCLNTVTIIM